MSKLIDIVLAEDTEGTLARLERWLLQPGDPVALDAPVAEIETDKVTLEIPAPASGVFREALVVPGEEITPGAVLGRIDPLPAAGAETAELPAVEVRFPEEQTEGTAATLSRWLVAVGEAARAGQPLAEIETDKVTIEVSAPVSGTLQEIAVAEGESLTPGARLGSMRPGVAPAEPDLAPPGVAGPVEDRGMRDAGERVSPAVRRLMAEHGLESLEGIRGSGSGGRVQRDDLLAWLGERPAAGGTGPPGARVASRMVAHSNMRRSIARHMADSLREAPHVTSVFEADLGAVVRHRGKHRRGFEDQGVKLSYTAYFLSAAARAMATVPEVNARFHADALEVFEEVNIGVGTALADQGLIVPVVRGVQNLDLLAIARELQDKTERARTGSLTPEDLRDGTFTVSNHGVSGSLLAAPIIINQPQVAILGIGKLEKRLQVYERDGQDKVRIRPMCYVSLSIDHRALDAHQTNRWLSVFVETLEHWPGSGPLKKGS